MKIIVTFAVDWELKPWRRLRSFHRAPNDDRIFLAQIGGNDIKAMVTGVGSQNAIRTIRACLEETPDLCVVSGLAGGLKREHRSGDILVAHTVRRQAEPERFASDETLFSLAVECGAKPAEDFVSTAEVARTSRRKSELAAFAEAVDMESFAIMEEMDRSGVPCVAIRSVADEVELDLMCDFDQTLDTYGRVRIPRVLGQVARSPKELLPLVRFAVISSRAASALAHFLDAYVVRLGGHSESLELQARQAVQ